MADRWHLEWLKEGVARWNKRRKKVDFSPDLSGIRFFDHLPKDFRDDPKTSRYFEKIDLSGSNLEGSDLSDLNFSRANFSDANLSQANLSKSNFGHAKFIRSRMTDADATRSIFDGAVFEEAKIAGLNLEKIEAADAVFIATDITPAQERAISAQEVQVFASRASYKDTISKSGAISNASLPPPRTTEPPKDDRTYKTTYDVYYGTNRGAMFERGALVGFSSEQSPKLRFGVCEVVIPDSRPIGKIGTPIFRRLFNKKDSTLKIESNISLYDNLFWHHLIRTAEKVTDKARPTLFIHGYNNSFETAVLRAAQIGHDLGIGQGIGLFSWPSRGKFLRYAADEASAEASKYDLANFLEEYVNYGSNMGINIIAHSMGCRVLLGAFEELAQRQSSTLEEIHQIILAAADVDNRMMPHLGSHAIKHSKRITSYVSGLDKALRLSGWLHSFPRIGKTPPTYVMDGMDTIIVNEMDLGHFSHAYLASSRVILNDVFGILKNGLPPEKRHGLETIEEGSLRYWKIRN